MTKITLKDLAERALNNNYTITKKEAIDIWLLIPEGCEREQRTIIGNIMQRIRYEEYLIVKGLGEFKIE